MREQGFEVFEENGRRSGKDELRRERAARLVALGKAISDPIRARMLEMMADGRGCCELPECGVPVEDRDAGICVCEFESYFGMGQSKVSYHMRKLKEAGLVREEKRGRWSFYSLDREATRSLAGDVAEHLGVPAREADR